MLRIAFHAARHRIGALVAVACAVLGGAALVTGTGVLAESGLRAHVPTDRLAGVDLVVAARQSVPQQQDLPVALPERARVPVALVAEIAKVPGVSAAIGDLSFPAALIGGRVPDADPGVAGHGWSSAGLGRKPRIDGTPPIAPDEVAVSRAAGVHPGELVRLVVAGKPGAYRVSAVVDAPGIYFADATAGRLAGHPDTVDLICVRGNPAGLTGVRNLVRDKELTFATGPARGDVESPGAAAARDLLIVLASSLAGITLLLVGFIVAGALTVSFAGQRRDLALLRAVGATPRQVRRLVAAQATVVGAVALVPGAAVGYLLAEQLHRLLVRLDVLPAGLPLALGPLPTVAAALLLGVVIQAAARSAAWRTSRLPATAAVTESRVEPRTPSRLRARIGLLLIVAATAGSVGPLFLRSQAGAAQTAIAGLLAAVGLALAGPALVRSASAALARRLSPRAAAPTWLAVANTHGYPVRVAAAATTLAMAVVFTQVYTLTQTTLMAATSNELKAGTLAQTSVTAPGLGGLPDGTLDAVRQTPGVRTAATVGTTTVLWPYLDNHQRKADSAPALILTPDAPGVLDLDVRAGSLAELTGATVAVSTDVARSRHAGAGRDVELILGDGTRVTTKVVAEYARGLGFGPVVVSRDLALAHTTTGLDQSILVRTDDPDALGRLGLAVSSAKPGTLGSPPPYVWVNLAVLAVLLGYVLLGIANKLVAGTAERRTELAALRLAGTTPRQIRAMLRCEAALIAAGALGAGLALSVVPLALLGIGFLHRPWPAGPFWLLPATVTTVAAVAWLATELPARRALRVPPTRLIGRD
jgi:putative ABC transport system permease protein